jgi:hypothetical protein
LSAISDVHGTQFTASSTVVQILISLRRHQYTKTKSRKVCALQKKEISLPKKYRKIHSEFLASMSRALGARAVRAWGHGLWVHSSDHIVPDFEEESGVVCAIADADSMMNTMLE